ncbi:MAG: IS1096 element passenger TnpR family protein, partial [Bacteroidales bacterium]
IEGERECPPEDCGGIPGYNYMLAVLKDPNHDDYNDIREYFGFGPDEQVDLDYVDFEEINMTFDAIF